MNIVTEIQNALDRCSIGIDTTTFEGKKKMVTNFLDQLDRWRDQWAKDYLVALESNDLSPAEFDDSRKQFISVG